MFNQPKKSKLHQVYDALTPRIQLAPEHRTTYERLRKGYEGEKYLFELLPDSLKEKSLIICDVNLQVNGSVAQYDLLILLRRSILHMEIKNFMGNFEYEDERFSILNGNEINNPLHQLSRSKLLLEKFLQKRKLHIPVESYLAFVHPQFLLYQAPKNLPIIFPNQLQNFVEKLNVRHPDMNPFQQNIKNKIIQNNDEKLRDDQCPQYAFDTIKKGVFCQDCRSSLKRHNKQKLICSKCNKITSLEASLMQSVNEFSILFPGRYITVPDIYEWTDGAFTKVFIQIILKKHFTLIAKSNQSYYRPRKTLKRLK